MSLNYDFSKQPNYLKRNMFLDGAVTVQRYEDYAFPLIAQYDQAQQGAFWRPEEISLMKDKSDFKEASEAERHAFTSNILRQTALDSAQAKSPSACFLPVCSVPELESLMFTWSFFETIHSRSYSHIIKNVYNVPKAEFNKIHDTQEIVSMAANIGKYYDDLYRLNCQAELGQSVSEEAHIKAIWLAMIASFGLEAIRFMISFATAFGMVENKKFIGNGSIISLIAQDETYHTDWTAYIINTLRRKDKRFAEIAEMCKEESQYILDEVVREEKDWAKYLFKKGPVVGLNETIMQNFAEANAATQYDRIGMKYPTKHTIASTLPWYPRHLATERKQTALQENESQVYIIGAMTTDVDFSKLPNL